MIHLCINRLRGTESGTGPALEEGMRVSNRTPWRTDQLKAIAKRVAETELDPAKRSRFLLRFPVGETATERIVFRLCAAGRLEDPGERASAAC
jgi:hypothetical protein